MSSQPVLRRLALLCAGALLLAAPAVLAGNASVAAVPSAAAAAGISVGAERAVVAARPGNLQRNADVAWNGTSFLVVWEEFPSAGGPGQVYAARVSATGKVLDPKGIRLSTSTDDHRNPTVAAGAGRFLVVWESRPEGTYDNLGAAMVGGGGNVLRRWTLSSSDNDQLHPDATWGGAFFLVVWEDMPDAETFDIYGARVLSSGLTLDGCSSDACGNEELGLPIDTSDGTDQLRPAVVPSSGTFFVSWQDEAVATPYDIEANGVQVNGDRFLFAPIAVGQAAGSQTDPADAANGGHVLTAWTDGRAGADVYSRVIDWGSVDPFGASVPPSSGTAVSAGAGEQSQPAATQRGTGFLVAWTDTRAGTPDVRAARVGTGGRVLDAGGVPVATGPRAQEAPALGTGGGVQLLAYQHDVPGATYAGRDRVFVRVLH